MLDMPAPKDIQIPLLKVIFDKGGEITTGEAFIEVMALFPEFAINYNKSHTRSEKVKWENRVKSARYKLARNGYIDGDSPAGIWRITGMGRKYLKDNPFSVIELKQKPEEIDVIEDGNQHLSKDLKKLLSQIGDILLHYPECDFHEPPYVYDVIWKTYPKAPRAGWVFVLLDKENLNDALIKLQHAKDIWGSKLFVLVAEENERAETEQLIQSMLFGGLRFLSRELNVLTQEQLKGIYEFLSKNRELFQSLLFE